MTDFFVGELKKLLANLLTIFMSEPHAAHFFYFDDKSRDQRTRNQLARKTKQ